MIVHDEGESDAGSTPCKDSTLIVRQVPAGDEGRIGPLVYIILYILFCDWFIHRLSSSILFPCCVDHVLVLFLYSLWPWRAAQCDKAKSKSSVKPQTCGTNRALAYSQRGCDKFSSRFNPLQTFRFWYIILMHIIND